MLAAGWCEVRALDRAVAAEGEGGEVEGCNRGRSAERSAQKERRCGLQQEGAEVVVFVAAARAQSSEPSARQDVTSRLSFTAKTRRVRYLNIISPACVLPDVVPISSSRAPRTLCRKHKSSRYKTI